MAKRTVEEAADIAASWWADKVVKPKFDAGADSSAMVIAELLASMQTQSISDSSKEKFKNILKQKIIDRFEKTNYQIYLGCDYSPEGILSEAIAEADLPSGNAPWKTSMWIDRDGSVSVKYGYGATIKEL